MCASVLPDGRDRKDDDASGGRDLGIFGAAVALTRFITTVLGWLNLLAIFVPPIGAIMLVDQQVLRRRDHSSGSELIPVVARLTHDPLCAAEWCCFRPAMMSALPPAPDRATKDSKTTRLTPGDTPEMFTAADSSFAMLRTLSR